MPFNDLLVLGASVVGFIVFSAAVVYWMINHSESTDDDDIWEDGEK